MVTLSPWLAHEKSLTWQSPLPLGWRGSLPSSEPTLLIRSSLFVCHGFVQINSARQSQEPESIPVSNVPRKWPSMSKNSQVLGRLQQGQTAVDGLHVAFTLPCVLFLFLFMHNCWLNFCHLLFKHSQFGFFCVLFFVLAVLLQIQQLSLCVTAFWKCPSKQTRAFLIMTRQDKPQHCNWWECAFQIRSSQRHKDSKNETVGVMSFKVVSKLWQWSRNEWMWKSLVVVVSLCSRCDWCFAILKPTFRLLALR